MPAKIVPTWAKRLVGRFDNAKRRCQNPSDEKYPGYGGRGIEFRFKTATEATLYFIEATGITEDDLDTMEIDRIENDGHYERGNLRMATRLENVLNRGYCHVWTHGDVQVPHRHVGDVLGVLWPECYRHPETYRRLWRDRGFRTLDEVREYFGKHVRGRRKHVPRRTPPNVEVAAQYLGSTHPAVVTAKKLKTTSG